jgi:hypothetical protein
MQPNPLKKDYKFVSFPRTISAATMNGPAMIKIGCSHGATAVRMDLL